MQSSESFGVGLGQPYNSSKGDLGVLNSARPRPRLSWLNSMTSSYWNIKGKYA